MFTDAGVVSPTFSAKGAHNPRLLFTRASCVSHPLFVESRDRGAGVRPEGELRVHVRHDGGPVPAAAENR